MNLFDLHIQPSPHRKDEDLIPKIAWIKYKNDPIEMMHHEDLWAKDAFCAFWYAFTFLKGPFSLGEDVIAKNAYFSYMYADDVLHAPFPLGEDAIAKDAECTYLYATEILNKPFPKGEKTIIKDWYYYNVYIQNFPKRKSFLNYKSHS